MIIEYEATFTGLERDEARTLLTAKGATLVRPDFLQKRVVLDFPPTDSYKGFLRVRDEGNRITLTHKIVGTGGITDQRETMIVVDDFDKTVALLVAIGCTPVSYEETRRELWTLDDVEITIDEWPHMGVMIEIEGKSEDEVQRISETLGFVWSQAKFCTPGHFYKEKYGLGPADLGRKTGIMTQLTFHDKNPFV